jgi:uncharacterized protein
MISSLRVQVSEIGVDGAEIEVHLRTGWFEKHLADIEVRRSEADGATALVQASLSASGRDVVVRGEVVADLEVPCARCLEPARLSIRAELSLLLEPASRSRLLRPASEAGSGSRGARAPEYEFSGSEADLDVFDADTVILDNFVREAILLEIPNFVLCSGSCPGISLARGDGIVGPDAISPELASDSEIDPRLAPLGAFLDQPDPGPVTAADLVAAAAARSAAISGRATNSRKAKPKLTSASTRRTARIAKKGPAQPAESTSPEDSE